ncbi:hypothetical protein MB27_11380 [Actinoplanes utahensis]|uniref:Uncharacterized protein n=1 Tax=Actinoplanes utahensis TaxID=1869 RepID=A0A0A6UML4_ACTUT|nr:hypothetical protein MB27_11380 [Actinoplanes utahensis]
MTFFSVFARFDLVTARKFPDYSFLDLISSIVPTTAHSVTEMPTRIQPASITGERPPTTTIEMTTITRKTFIGRRR